MCNLALSIALSAHIALQGNYNQVHPTIECAGEAFRAGAFLNSEGTGSAFLAYRLQRGGVWLDLGLVTGYSDADILPFVRAGVDLTDRARLFIAPAFETWDGETRVGAIIGVEVTLGGVQQ